MFGGLTRTSSRIAIAAAFGLALGGYALSAGPAKAADFGGDCCADLEERVAELEATTVRKGNRKVSVTLSGWVVKTVNWWWDGDLHDTWIGDKDADLTSRFALTGSATISPGWSAGYNITVTVPGDFTGGGVLDAGNVFGIASNQFAQDSVLIQGINTLYSYMYIKSDHWGTINWGYLSPASDNAAVLADLSGTVIETNAVFFEGPGFFVNSSAGLTGVTWGNFLTCSLVGGIGADCYGAPQNGIRYDSPTWQGFRVEAGYSRLLSNVGAAVVGGATPEVWDVAVFYTGDWGDWKTSVAYSFTHSNGNIFSADPTASVNIHQVGATIMHTPSGLGLYGLYQNEEVKAAGIPQSDVWYLKPFWKKTWSPLGATVFFGEYGEYKDQHAGNFGPGASSKVRRAGLGVVQEIDAAAMHVFARWQHQELSANDVIKFDADVCGGPCSFDNWDLFQIGGVIFF